MSNVNKINQNNFICNTVISQFEQMLGKEAFEDLIEVYNKIVLKNKDAEMITELLQVFFSSGYLKGLKDANDLLS